MRIEQLTFTRFLAAISIVFYHFGKDSSLYNVKILTVVFENANLAVSYFFVLSGFVLMYSCFSKDKLDSLDFYRKRFARIYPLYLFALLLTLVVKQGSKVDIILSVFMLQTWFPSKAIILNNPGWSLSVELLFYGLFPLLFNQFFKKYSFKNICWLIVGFWVVSQVLFWFLFDYSQNKDLLYHPLLHLNEFLIGNLSAIIFLRTFNSKKNNSYFFSIVLVLGLIYFCMCFAQKINFHNGLLAGLYAVFIMLLAASDDRITAFFKKKFFIALGEISYAIYILQFPVWVILTDFRLKKYFHLDGSVGPDVKFVFRILFLIGLSTICYYLLEIPLKKYLLKKRNYQKIVVERERAID